MPLKNIIMKKKKIKVGVVGIGHLGNYHLQKYHKLENCEVVAVADPLWKERKKQPEFIIVLLFLIIVPCSIKLMP